MRLPQAAPGRGEEVPAVPGEGADHTVGEAQGGVQHQVRTKYSSGDATSKLIVLALSFVQSMLYKLIKFANFTNINVHTAHMLATLFLSFE